MYLCRGSIRYYTEQNKITEVLKKINRDRFDNLFQIENYEPFAQFTFTGAEWFRWLTFEMIFHRSELRWRHSDDDIIATEWVTFTFGHKACRILKPGTTYMEENIRMPVDFDLRFPTLDLWIRELYHDSPEEAENIISETKLITPDCFWISRPEE